MNAALDALLEARIKVLPAEPKGWPVETAISATYP